MKLKTSIRLLGGGHAGVVGTGGAEAGESTGNGIIVAQELVDPGE
ncbi:hypothetical protein ACFQYP_19065 [Nonomuraea antimicrobica]